MKDEEKRFIEEEGIRTKGIEGEKGRKECQGLLSLVCFSAGGQPYIRQPTAPPP